MNTDLNRPVTADELAAHVDATRAIYEAHITRCHGAKYLSNFPVTFEVRKGRKYAKIITVGSQTMVHHFVNLHTGEILKAATFKAPAKHARGNIRQENLKGSVGPHGAAYLR